MTVVGGRGNFIHLGASSGKKDTVCTGTGNFKVQKVPSKAPMPLCGRETEVPMTQWTGSG